MKRAMVTIVAFDSEIQDIRLDPVEVGYSGISLSFPPRETSFPVFARRFGDGPSSEGDVGADAQHFRHRQGLRPNHHRRRLLSRSQNRLVVVFQRRGTDCLHRLYAGGVPF